MRAETVNVVISISGRKKYARKYDLIHQSVEPIEIMTDKKDSRIRYNVATTIPQVFGDFSSLKVEVGVDFPGDPNNLAEEVDQFDAKMDHILQTKVNSVLKAQGKEGLTL